MIYRHKKRGTEYRIEHYISFQDSNDNYDNKTIVMYRDINSGKAYARLEDNFFDGRFEEVTDD